MKTNGKKNKMSLVFLLSLKYGGLWPAGVSDKYIYAN